jgi:hypothetical protein
MYTFSLTGLLLLNVMAQHIDRFIHPLHGIELRTDAGVLQDKRIILGYISRNRFSKTQFSRKIQIIYIPKMFAFLRL